MLHGMGSWETREFSLHMCREKSVSGSGKQDAKAPKIGMCVKVLPAGRWLPVR